MKVKILASIAAGVVICIVLSFLVADRVSSNEQTPLIKRHPASVSQQNNTFSDWLDRFEQYPDGIDPQFLQEGVRLAQERRHRMQDLIQRDPQAALNSRISPEIRASLPKDIKSLVETPFSSMGEVKVLIGCGDGFVSVDRITTLEDGTRFRAFPTSGDRFVKSVQDVPLSGIHMNGIGVLQNAYTRTGDPYPQDPIGQASHTPDPMVVHSMYVILVDFSDLAGIPANAAVLDDLINTDVSQQIYEMSHHQVSVECIVDTDLHRLPQTMAFYESDLDQMYADAVTEAGINDGDYNTVCVFFDNNPNLGFAGLAATPGREMWINGYIPGVGVVITHELGHNFGSLHSHSWDVAGADPVGAGAKEEYGDPTDIMGEGGIPKGHFHVQNKLEIGWLTGSNYTNVATSGTYRVYRSDHAETDLTAASVRGLRIQKSLDPDYYWLGYRQLYDNLENYGRGLYVLWQKQGEVKSHLLDLTPGSVPGISEGEKKADREDGGLALGMTYSDTVADIHITPIARGGWEPNEYMDVVINLGDFAGNSDPVASESWPTTGDAREAIVFEVSASDADGDDLAYSWDFGDGLVKPNANRVSHAWAAGGSYTVSCTVTDMKGGTHTVLDTVTVSDPLEKSWTEMNSISNFKLNDIIEGDGALVTVGNRGVVGTSSDGISWSMGTVAPVFNDYINVFLNSVIYDGTQFVAAGFDINLGGQIFTSPDGVIWTNRQSGGSWLEDIAYHGGVYLAVGDTSTVLRSTNGTSWSPVATGISGTYKSIIHTGSTFLVSGSTFVAMTSADGLTWTEASLGSPNPDIYELAVLNGEIFGSGIEGSFPGRGIHRISNDVTTYETLNADSIFISGFCYGNGLYFGAVNNFSDSLDRNFVSANGTDWVELTTAAQDDRNAAIFFDDAIITVGGVPNTSGSVWKSPTIVTSGEGWGSWELLNRSQLGLNRDPEDDADCDGANNLLEYALGTDAIDPTSVPSVSSAQDSSGRLVIYVPRAREALDLNHIVEQATGLGESAVWDSLETEQVSETDDEIVYRTLNPVTSANPQFLRLRVEIAPPAP